MEELRKGSRSPPRCDSHLLPFQKRPVSFLSIDTEGRVLRFDSFSKIMSPGFRVGFCTGPKHLIGRIELHVQAASLHAASLPQVNNLQMKPSLHVLPPENCDDFHCIKNYIVCVHILLLSFQVIIDKVIDTWGYDKLFAHIDSIRNYYKSKRDLMIEASNKYLTGKTQFDPFTCSVHY